MISYEPVGLFLELFQVIVYMLHLIVHSVEQLHLLNEYHMLVVHSKFVLDKKKKFLIESLTSKIKPV